MISYSLSVPKLYISHKIMEQKSNGTLNMTISLETMIALVGKKRLHLYTSLRVAYFYLWAI